MSDFKSEILPSGAELQISNAGYCISTTENYVRVTKEDINRMHGIAFPEKRRTGECYNTTASTEVDDINVADLTQPSDKYEQRVQQMAEQLMFEEYKIESAKIAVESQAEAITHALQYVSHTPEIIINAFLGQNGYRLNGYEQGPECSIDPSGPYAMGPGH